MNNKHSRRLLISGYAMLIIMIVFVGVCDYLTPSDAVIFSDESVSAAVSVPFVELDEDESNGKTTASIFGVVPLKEVSVSTVDRISLCPGGVPFGVKFYTKGVIVVGINEVETADGVRNPSSAAGLKIGDIITRMNGETVNTVKEVTAIIEKSGGSPIELQASRGGDTVNLSLAPVLSTVDGAYRAGLWIRDSTAGIGTITFYDPSTGAFAGLGHSICDVDTGMLMPMLRGDIYDVSITDITQGKPGYPGELKGSFGASRIGALTANTPAGIFGIYSGGASFSDAIPIALKNEVKEGKAEIICTVSDGKAERYEAEIVKLNRSSTELKNFIIRITDERLLSLTGGIVQGMSGSPVIQDGHLVGAVTHVLVNDPTKGYGIFIENMLKNMPSTTSARG